MLVTGIDPGKAVGWATLFLAPGQRPRRVDSGEWTHEEAFAAIRSGVFLRHMVAIERADGFYASKARGQSGGRELAGITRDLLDAAYFAGEARGLLLAAGGRAEYVRVADAYRATGVKVGAQRGRGVLAGETLAKQTARILSLMVDEWPKVSNQHERDAALDAIYAARVSG